MITAGPAYSMPQMSNPMGVVPPVMNGMPTYGGAGAYGGYGMPPASMPSQFNSYNPY
jgi:hypothetical protein